MANDYVWKHEEVADPVEKAFQPGGRMTEANVAIDKLRKIQALWENLNGIKANTPEYNVLVKQISVLSAEYQKLAAAAERPKSVSTDNGKPQSEISRMAGPR